MTGAMSAEQRGLWERLAAMPLGGGPLTRGFARRLARENGWSSRYAAGAIEEYRRFLLLLAAAGHPVSPSEPIDRVWHLHLLYTRSYWGELCGEIVGRPLHHLPAGGDPQEAQTFRDWYADTLASYARLFGAAAPEAWWPPPGTPHGDHRVVDPQRVWVVPKVWPWRR